MEITVEEEKLLMRILSNEITWSDFELKEQLTIMSLLGRLKAMAAIRG